MPALWDTTLASRLQPGGDVLDHVIDQARAGTPVRLAAPAVLEIAYGYQRHARADERYRRLLDWFTRLLADRTVLSASDVISELMRAPLPRADRAGGSSARHRPGDHRRALGRRAGLSPPARGHRGDGPAVPA